MADDTRHHTSVAEEGPLLRLVRTLRADPHIYCGILIAGLAANLFSGHSHRLGVPLSPDRLLIPLAVLLLLRDPTRVRYRRNLVGGLMLALVVWTVVSMVWYGNVLSTVHLFALLDRMVMPFLLFLLGPMFFSRTQDRDLLLKALMLIGAYLAGTACLEVAAPQLVFPRYIINPDVGLHFGRPRGPFAEAEAMSMALALCSGASVLLAGRHLPRWSGAARPVAVACMFGVVLTTTRSVWVGVAVGVCVAMVQSRRLRRWLPAIAAAGAAGAAGVFMFMPSVTRMVFERTTSTGPIYDRLSSNAAALRVLGDLPLTGIGWRRFYPYGAEWARQSDLLPMNNAVIEVHNVILSRGAELGVPAMLVFVLIIVLGPVRAARRAPADPEHPDLAGWRVLCGYAISVWLVAGLFGPQATPFPNYAVWLVTGVATSTALTWPRGATGSAPPRSVGTVRPARSGVHRPENVTQLDGEP